MKTKREQTFVVECSTGVEYAVAEIYCTYRGEYHLVLKDAEGRCRTVDLEELLDNYASAY